MTIDTNQTIPEPKPSFSLWNQLETKQITKEQLPITLFKKLGEPSNELQANLAQEILKKIISYYFSAEAEQNYTIYSVVGTVQEIIQRKWKEGPKKGQVYYDLILGGTGDMTTGMRQKLKAQQELLKPEQWTQIVKLALLGQNLVFQYRKWFSNKQILGWYLATKSSKS
jgi:hypothetical protein